MFWQNLRHLWRRHDFRRILGVRVATQAADGTLQVGMASHVLLSPEQQPDAWSITMVLAITLLPFSIIGPFISVVLVSESSSTPTACAASSRSGWGSWSGTAHATDPLTWPCSSDCSSQ